MNTFDKFKHYYNQYYQHYGRALTKKQDKTNFAYDNASENKQINYNYHQKWLESHHSFDKRMTVLTKNAQSFIIGCVYHVTLDNYYKTCNIFRVITPTKIYEWYISGDYRACVPLAPVPEHRIKFHNTKPSWLTEMDIDMQTIYTSSF